MGFLLIIFFLNCIMLMGDNMGKKNSKKIQQQLEKKKKKELKKSKIDKLNYAIIIFIMIILPLWQIVRIQFISLNRTDLYNDLHAGYFLWIAGAGLLITYIINLIKKRIKIDKVDLTIYFFIISVIISTILAEDKNLAIFGINDRYEGILTLISYALIILTVKSLPFKRRYLTFINILMILGVVQSFSAIIQCFVRSNYILKFSFSFMANALCGNPNYLGSYMMIESLLAILLKLPF